ncbi:hypothetical protein Aba9102_07885 [Acinetobacter baumannii]|nr:hypothetical protein Aba9102_07885 [Acinetobacter baumannii]
MVYRLIAQLMQRPFVLNLMPAEGLRARLIKASLSEVIVDAVISMKARGAYHFISGDIEHLTRCAPCSLAEILARADEGLRQL